VQGLRAPQDMVSCGRQRCLYVADSDRDVVHRVLSDGVSSVWPLKDKPSALSVIRRLSDVDAPCAASNLLVTFTVSRKLREYSPDGRMLRQISLDASIGMQLGVAYWLGRRTCDQASSDDPLTHYKLFSL